MPEKIARAERQKTDKEKTLEGRFELVLNRLIIWMAENKKKWKTLAAAPILKL